MMNHEIPLFLPHTPLNFTINILIYRDLSNAANAAMAVSENGLHPHGIDMGKL